MLSKEREGSTQDIRPLNAHVECLLKEEKSKKAKGQRLDRRYHKKMLKIPLLVFLACPCLLSAQQHAGNGSPGSGGFIPQLTAPHAWMGNPSYTMSLQNGLGGASGMFGISAGRRPFTWNGAPVWIDPSELVYQTSIALGGAVGVAGDGSYDLTLTLPPLNMNLVGRRFYAQVAVFDAGAAPSGVCTSNAVTIDLVTRPNIFVGTSMAPPSNAYSLDGISLTENAPQFTFPHNVMGSAAHSNSLDEYVGVVDTGVYHGDSRSGTTVWSLLWASTAGYYVEGIHIDEQHDVLWTLSSGSNSALEFVCIDIDPSSSTYGQRIAETSGLYTNGPLQKWTMSPDSKTGVVVKILSDLLYVYDLDPTSPTFLQNTDVLNVPAHNNSPLHLVTTVLFSPDGSELFAAVQHAGLENSEIGRYDVAAGVWIDHNPNVFGVQCLGDMSDPVLLTGSGAFGMDVSDDHVLFVAGPFAPFNGGGGSNDGWLSRIELTPLSGSGYSTTQYTGAVPDAFEIALNHDQTILAVGTPDSLTSDIQFFDTGTLSFIGGVLLSGSRNIYDIHWR